MSLAPDVLLSTTRSVRRRLDLDRPVPLELVRECIEVAVQAPTGSNLQEWAFVVVTDPEVRAGIGTVYARAWDVYKRRAMDLLEARSAELGPAWRRGQDRVMRSAQYLADNLGRVPVLVIPCVQGRSDRLPAVLQATQWGSILPATWSFMLAARARGLGSVLTTLHLIAERDVAELVGIPFKEVMQAALVPVAYVRGNPFKPGPRRPLDGVVHVDRW